MILMIVMFENKEDELIAITIIQKMKYLLQ